MNDTKNVDLVYRTEHGWCVLQAGSSGHIEYIPIKTYIERLHMFFDIKDGPAFAPANMIPAAPKAARKRSKLARILSRHIKSNKRKRRS